MIHVEPISAFDDNYLWLIKGPDQKAVVVDPGDGHAVIRAMESKALALQSILITHHHNDHIGGVQTLLHYRDVPVYGPLSPKIPQITHPLADGDTLDIFSSPQFSLKVIEVPGHTRDHIAYFGKIENKYWLFCGDTLFAAGCGRLFDGTHQQLNHSLNKLNSLPAETEIYCAHEYTLSNLAFAKAVEPDNQAIAKRIDNEQNKRKLGLPTLPSTLALEQATNPFLRLNQATVQGAINQYWNSDLASMDQLFTGLRRWKDEF
ncbi:MAG: hydroxyacylglutathione hydrolase [Pseudomonadota bacterium]